MHERLFSAAWDSLSPKEQEAFEAWSKAVFKANEAQKNFMHIYLSKELKASSDKDLDAAVLSKADEDFETFKKKLLAKFVTKLTLCDCSNAENKILCLIKCMMENK